jgi:hypothetical protein
MVYLYEECLNVHIEAVKEGFESLGLHLVPWLDRDLKSKEARLAYLGKLYCKSRSQIIIRTDLSVFLLLDKLTQDKFGLLSIDTSSEFV